MLNSLPHTLDINCTEQLSKLKYVNSVGKNSYCTFHSGILPTQPVIIDYERQINRK